jgi:hypothetical protein
MLCSKFNLGNFMLPNFMLPNFMLPNFMLPNFMLLNFMLLKKLVAQSYSVGKSILPENPYCRKRYVSSC